MQDVRETEDEKLGGPERNECKAEKREAKGVQKRFETLRSENRKFQSHTPSSIEQITNPYCKQSLLTWSSFGCFCGNLNI